MVKKENGKNGIGLNHCTKTTSCFSAPVALKLSLHFLNALDYQSLLKFCISCLHDIHVL